MPKQNENRTKGTFSDVRLPVAKKYVFPLSRTRMMIIGGVACALVALYFVADAFLLNNTFIARGPLSVNHANFESDCAKCHQSFKGVKDSKCSTCHEKTNDKLGVYTFAAHYLYRSENPERIASAKSKHTNGEQACASCHPDHQGRAASITVVNDAKCATCHHKSFNDDHPEFEFARTNAPDDSTLKMTHVVHTKAVLKKLNTANLEAACLYCHTPQPDGKTFKSLDYDAHCGDCHLTTSSESASLAIKEQANVWSLGVETLELIQRRRGPGTLWSFYTNPNEFQINGNKVKKSPVYHRDPWILENLKQIRQMLYGDAGISELLKAPEFGAKKGKRMKYGEAIATLRDYVTGLRSRPEPEVQMELARIDSILKIAERRVMSSGAVLSDSLFQLMPALQRQDIEDFALKVAKPCLECHYVQHAGILSVKASQRTLVRAEFDHRAHTTQRRCLECHDAIPIEQALLGDTTGAAEKIFTLDKSSTQNLPRIQNCFECHTASAGSNNCRTCHFMHPNKENRGNLQLFVEKK